MVIFRARRSHPVSTPIVYCVESAVLVTYTNLVEAWACIVDFVDNE